MLTLKRTLQTVRNDWMERSANPTAPQHLVQHEAIVAQCVYQCVLIYSTRVRFGCCEMTGNSRLGAFPIRSGAPVGRWSDMSPMRLETQGRLHSTANTNTP